MHYWILIRSKGWQWVMNGTSIDANPEIFTFADHEPDTVAGRSISRYPLPCLIPIPYDLSTLTQ